MTKLSTTDIDHLTAWNREMDTPNKIELIQTDHPENNHFSDVAGELEIHAPNLQIIRSQGEGLPGFRFADNILFSALPLQRELDPFLAAISLKEQDRTGIDRSMEEMINRIEVPVHLKLYIALACPHCPLMVKQIIPLALQCSHVQLSIIDGSLFTEQAQEDQVLSAPCLILDDDFRWTGQTELPEILKMITSRDFSQLSAQTLRSILEQGDADRITREIIQKGVVFDNFLKLLLHETWSVRLGAMVVLEGLVEQAPELAASICPVLIGQFDQSDTTLKGDILYALGEAGGPETAAWIEKELPRLSHDDLIDTAKDALEMLALKNE